MYIDEALQKLAQEAEDAHDAGTMTRELFDDLLARGLKIVGSETRLLECVAFFEPVA